MTRLLALLLTVLLSACAGSEIGAIRASLGLANNTADIARLVALLEGFA